MITCPKCHCAAYCSNQHLEDDKAFHLKSCKRLQTALQDYQIQQKLKSFQISANIKTAIARVIQNFIIQFDRYEIQNYNIFLLLLPEFYIFKYFVTYTIFYTNR